MQQVANTVHKTLILFELHTSLRPAISLQSEYNKKETLKRDEKDRKLLNSWAWTYVFFNIFMVFYSFYLQRQSLLN